MLGVGLGIARGVSLAGEVGREWHEWRTGGTIEVEGTVGQGGTVKASGHQTMLDFGQALIAGLPTFTFPRAQNLKK